MRTGVALLWACTLAAVTLEVSAQGVPLGEAAGPPVALQPVAAAVPVPQPLASGAPRTLAPAATAHPGPPVAAAPPQPLAAAAAAAAEPGPLPGEVAFATSPSPAALQDGTGPQPPGAPNCTNPCYVVEDYYPYRTCKQECNPDICRRNWGVWASKDVCCAPGVAFPEGCSQRPSQCWVAESFELRTCVRDDRKCLQGYGVFHKKQTCCLPGAVFSEGCATNLTLSPEPCWVVDSYYPARTCRATQIACDKRSQKWATREACCAPQGGAFGLGCSTYVPRAPCYLVDAYSPVRTCKLETDAARCNRGWGVYQSLEVCCAPGAAFSEGCTVSVAAPASPAAAGR